MISLFACFLITDFQAFALQLIIQLQKLNIVGPAQKVRSLRTFWVNKVKLPETLHIAAAETLAVAESKISAEAGEQTGAVVGPGFAALLKFHDVTRGGFCRGRGLGGVVGAALGKRESNARMHSSASSVTRRMD